MATTRTLEIELEVDNSGAIRGFRQVGGEAGNLRAQVQATGNDMVESFADAQARSELLAGDMSDVGIRADRSFELARQGAIDYANAAQRAAGTTQRMNRVQGRTNLLLFDFADFAQDAQFGVRAVGNNVGFLLERWDQWNRAIPETETRWSVLRSALTTPAGLFVFAQVAFTVSTLVQQMGLLEGVFDDNAQAAENFRENLRDSIDAVIEFNDAFELDAAQVETVEQAEAALQAVRERVQAQRESIEHLQEAARLSRLAGVTLGGAASAQEDLTATQDAFIEGAETQIAHLSTIEESLNDRLTTLRREQTLRDILVGLGFDLARADESAAEAAERRARAHEDANEAMSDQIEEMEEGPVPFDPSFFETPMETAIREADIDIDLPDIFRDPQAIQDDLNEQMDEAVSEMEVGPITSDFRGAEDLFGLEFADFEGFFEDTEDGLSDVQRQLLQMASASTRAFTQMITGARETDEAIQDLLASLMRSAGAALIQAGRLEIGIPLLLGGTVAGAIPTGDDDASSGIPTARGPRARSSSGLIGNSETQSLLSANATSSTQSGDMVQEVRRLGDRIENLTVVTDVEDVVEAEDQFRDRRSKVSVQP